MTLKSVKGAALIGLVAVGAMSLGQVQDWVSRFDGGGNPDNNIVASATDAQGSLYIAGTAGDDVDVVKYAGDGSRLWVARFGGGDSTRLVTSPATCNGMVSAPDGGAYIVGSVSPSMFVARISSSGTILWTNYYNSGLDGSRGEGILSGPAGEIYVIGIVSTPTGVATTVVVRYSASGDETWEQRLANVTPRCVTIGSDGLFLALRSRAAYPLALQKLGFDGSLLWTVSGDPNTDHIIPTSLCAYPDGGVCIAGQSSNTIIGAGHATIRYSRDGVLLWARTPFGVGRSSSEFSEIGLASDGSIYTASDLQTTDAPYQYYAGVRYDALGNQLALLPAPANGPLVPHSIAVTDSGVRVTGLLQSTMIVSAGYSLDGTSLWSSTYSALPAAANLKVGSWSDAAGNLLVAASVINGITNSDFLALKLGPDGSVFWDHTYNGAANGDDNAVAVAVDLDGNVITVGTSIGNNDQHNDIAVTKVSAAGNLLWSRTYDDPNHGDDTAVAVFTDSSGAVCVAGGTPGPLVLRYDRYGNLEWSNASSVPANAASAAMDANGNVYILGSSYPDMRLAKFAPTGALDWSVSTTGAFPMGVAADGSGNVYTSGLYYYENAYERNIVTKFTPDGQAIWNWTSPGHEVTCMAVDAAGDVYLGDEFGGLHKITPTGGESWSLAYGGGTGSLWQLALDPQGNLCAAVTIYSADYTSCQSGAAKFSPDGVLLWSCLVPDVSVMSAVAVDALGRVFATGAIRNQSNHYFTLACAPDGTELWKAQYAGQADGSDIASAIAVDSRGVYIAGTSWGGESGFDMATLKYALGVGELSGKVVLADYAGGAGIAGTADFRMPGALQSVFSVPVLLDGSGNFALSGLQEGVYDVAVKFPNWLRQVQHNVLVTLPGGQVNFSLTNGDADGSNAVNLLDLSTVLRYFNTAGPLGDLNWDGVVSLPDLSISLKNFNKRGDQ